MEEANFDVRDPSYPPESSLSDSEQLDFQIDQETVESIRTGTKRKKVQELLSMIKINSCN